MFWIWVVVELYIVKFCYQFCWLEYLLFMIIYVEMDEMGLGV